MYIETKSDKNYPIICVQMTQRNTSSLNEVTKIFYLATRVFAAMVNASVKTFLDYTIISLTNYTSKILWNLYENHISKSTSVHSGTYSMILLRIFHELLAIFTIINNYFFVKKARVLTSKTLLMNKCNNLFWEDLLFDKTFFYFLYFLKYIPKVSDPIKRLLWPSVITIMKGKYKVKIRLITQRKQ